MTLIGLIVVVAVTGLIVWAITTLVPMDPKFKQIIYVLAVVGLCFYLLNVFGLMGAIPNPRLK